MRFKGLFILRNKQQQQQQNKTSVLQGLVCARLVSFKIKVKKILLVALSTAEKDLGMNESVA